MVETVESADVATLPPAPKNPLPYWRRLKAARAFTPARKRCGMPAVR